MLRRQLKWNITVALGVCLLASAPGLHATLPQMYPTFSTPSTITNVNLYGSIASTDDLMAETTLQGAYNQLQGTNRLYITLDAQDVWWLQQSVPSTITVSTLSWTQTDPDGALKAMLSAYGSSIKGYYICDPVNIPESCNMATTLAGINDAMVVYPDNLTVMSGYSVPLMANGDLRNYLWVGSDQTLVNDTTLNHVSVPGGESGGGTTGWGTNCSSGQTLGTATYLNVANAIKWTSLANEGTGCTALYDPALGENSYYVFSVQVAGSGKVFLDAWDGEHDIQSSSVTLNSTGWQTLQLTVPIPSSDNANPVQIQVRANTTNNAVTCYFINAAVVPSTVAVDQYQYSNLISSTNSLAQAILDLDSYNDRDYYIAAKMFVYYVGSTSGTGTTTLFNNILTHWATMTPVLGYTVDEGPDVDYLSAAGYFINVSDKHRNGSVWASLSGPSSFTQPAPAGIKAQNGYVYVGMFQSDGDNTSLMYNLIRDKFATDPWLGAVPLGWSSATSSGTFWPNMYNYYYPHLPQSNEIMAGPSGVGYTTKMTGSNLTTFANLSNQFMTALDQSTVFSFENNATDVLNFATTLNLPHVMPNIAYANTQVSNSAGTIIDSAGGIAFNTTSAGLLSTIQSYVSANCSSSAPCFVEAQAINGNIWPSDELWVAQQLELQKASGQEYVFLTPSELAATWKNYHNGGTITATDNAQARTGTSLLVSYPQNYVQNPSGLDMTNMTGVFTLATTGNHESLMNDNYLGLTRYLEPSDGRIQLMTTDGNTTNDVIASAPINKVPWNGGTYDFQMQVAGSGTAKIGVYSGSVWTYSSVVTLTPAWQPLHVVSAAPASGGKVEVIIPAQTAAVTLHFAAQTYVPSGGWNMDGVVSGSTEDLTNTTYNYTPALLYTMSGSQGHTQEIAESTLPLKASTSYVWSADLAGSGTAYVEGYESGVLCSTSIVTLTTGYQTLTCTGSTKSSGTPGIFVVAGVSSSAQTIYVRNASVVPASSLGTIDFTTGVEAGQTQLTWTNTVDGTSPGGGESNVTSAVLQKTTSEMSYGGSNAIQYGGTASGGTSNYAYMEAFSNSTTLTSTSRLSYWIYPQSPQGAEPNASSTTGQNSTCVAIDIIFTDGTALRNLSATDQYWNPMNPSHQCNHLQPDRWNYVTADLTRLSGKTVSRIDVGYDQPNAPAGSYRGYIDDITLKH